MHSTATLSIMGGCDLAGVDGSHISIPNKKVRALLAYLVLEGNAPISRERLAGILWSEKGEALARQNLRQALVKLRAILDRAGFSDYSINRHEVFVDTNRLEVDVYALHRQLLDRDIDDGRVGDQFDPDKILYGLESLDGLFDTWLHHLRHFWKTRLSDHLQSLLEDDDFETAKRAADLLVSMDPTHEPAHRSLIRFYADQGNTPAAERHYRQLWEQLDAFDAEPDDATQALIVEIKSGQYRARNQDLPARQTAVKPSNPLPQAVPLPDLPKIFVHEFRQAEPNGGASALGNALRMELIANLVRFRDWTVLDGQEGMLNPNYQPVHSGDKQETHSYAIYGTVHETRTGSVLVITLKDLASGAYLWSDRFDTNVENWILAQRRISIQLAGSLNTHLSAKLAAFHIGNQEITNDAYLQWLDCHQKFWSWDPFVRKNLQNTLSEIIASYPSFAPAYTGLVTIINTQHVIYPGVVADQKSLSQAAEMAGKAVQLDPMDARNIGNFGWSSAINGQFELAATNFRRAMELNPNNPNSLIACANGLAMCEDPETGYQLTKEAMASLPTLTPVQWAYITSTFCLSEHYEECILAAGFAGTSMPTTHGFLAIALAMSGRTEEAKETGQSFLAAAREKWQATEPASRENICAWFLNHCPVRRVETRNTLQAGLQKAGLG